MPDPKLHDVAFHSAMEVVEEARNLGCVASQLCFKEAVERVGTMVSDWIKLRWRHSLLGLWWSWKEANQKKNIRYVQYSREDKDHAWKRSCVGLSFLQNKLWDKYANANSLLKAGFMHVYSVFSKYLWPHGCILLGSSVHEISQTRMLEWVAISSSRQSSQQSSRARDWNHFSWAFYLHCRLILYRWATKEAQCFHWSNPNLAPEEGCRKNLWENWEVRQKNKTMRVHYLHGFYVSEESSLEGLWLIRKDPDAGKLEGRRKRGWQRMRW